MTDYEKKIKRGSYW